MNHLPQHGGWKHLKTKNEITYNYNATNKAGNILSYWAIILLYSVCG